MRIGNVKNRIAIGSFALTLAAVPMVAGCSGNRSDQADGRGAAAGGETSSKLVSASLVAESASRSCAEVTTGHIDATLRVDGMEGREGSSTAKFTSDFDNESHRAAMTIDGAGLIPPDTAGDGGSPGMAGGFLAGFDAPLQVVVDGEDIYVNWPPMAQFAGMTEPWVQIPSMGVVESVNSVEGTTNCDFMDALSAVGGQVEEVGSEEVSGTATTRYSGKVDVAAALDEIPADKKAEVDRALERFGDASTEVPIEVWIDAEGLVRRFEASYAMRHAAGDGTAVANVTVELSRVGEPVDIQIPPADQIGQFDLTAMMGGMMGGAWTHD